MIWLSAAVLPVLLAFPGDFDSTPGDGLSLLPVAPVGAPTNSAEPSPAPPGPAGGGGSPWAWATAIIAAGWSTWRGRRSRGQPQDVPPLGMLVVFVGGFGTEPGAGFADLIRMMGLSADQVHHFDWRRARDVGDPTRASREASIDDAADALGGYLDGIATRGLPIYLVGHSKGGAAIAELVARWDAHPGASQRRVVGAMLLDPPLDDGLWGAFQSAGLALPLLPNDGGYDPLQCGFLRCRDTRENLGLRAGVEVVVVRNRDAWVTNFDDNPKGLRVYDLDDGGASAKALAVTYPVEAVQRIVDAHMSVLHHEAVAACAVAEMWRAGACEWE